MKYLTIIGALGALLTAGCGGVDYASNGDLKAGIMGSDRVYETGKVAGKGRSLGALVMREKPNLFTKLTKDDKQDEPWVMQIRRHKKMVTLETQFFDRGPVRDKDEWFDKSTLTFGSSRSADRFGLEWKLTY